MNVKILITYHKIAAIIQNSSFVPIHIGKMQCRSQENDIVFTDEEYYYSSKNMIGDNTGENFSKLRRYLCEFSAIYWAWKNYNQLENPDYIGFMHYRRHFIFNPNNKKLASREFSNYCPTYSFINREYEELIKPDHFNFSEYDLVIPEFLNFAKCSNKRYSNILESYLTYAGRDDMLLKIEEVVLKHPKLYKYKNFIKKFYQKEGFYPFNMFIMKKNLFFEYAEFIFTIFNEIWSDDIENSLKLRGLHYQRELAWALEIATSFFIQYQINNVKKRYKELPISFVKNTDLEIESITPVQRENPIGICLIYNKLIISYLSVVLQSLIENSDEKSVYDICILCIECIDKTDEKKLISLVKDKSYISLRFFMLDNFSCIRENDSFFKSKNSLNFDNYKIFIPRIFRKYNQVIYLSYNLLIKHNILELLSYKNKAINCSLDVYNSIIAFMPNSKIGKKINQDLKIINSELIVYNILECERNDFFNLLLEKLYKTEDAVFFNKHREMISFLGIFGFLISYFFNDRIGDIPLYYNFQSKIIDDKLDINVLPLSLYNEYVQAKDNFLILQYYKYFQPLLYDSCRFGNDLWWYYAKQSPYFGKIISGENHFIFGAALRIKEYLSYKIGFEIVKTKNLLAFCTLPYRVLKVIFLHRINILIYKIKLKFNLCNPKPKLKDYVDYDDIFKIKNHLAYRLGSVFLKNPFLFIFRVKQIYKVFLLEKYKGEKL